MRRVFREFRFREELLENGHLVLERTIGMIRLIKVLFFASMLARRSQQRSTYCRRSYAI
jgi:hypothetical protein